jgi:hypothetical protein
MRAVHFCHLLFRSKFVGCQRFSSLLPALLFIHHLPVAKVPAESFPFRSCAILRVRIQAQPFSKDPTGRCPTVAQFASFGVCGWSYTESKPAAAANVHVMIDWAFSGLGGMQGISLGSIVGRVPM